jgi:8-oxo-dGTP diphosphatase
MVKLLQNCQEVGEGTVDCLKRELLEELNIEITDITPFYIQENYIESFVKNQKQLVILYFKARIVDITKLKIKDSNIIDIHWAPLDNTHRLSLPSDIQMFKYLLTNFS